MYISYSNETRRLVWESLMLSPFFCAVSAKGRDKIVKTVECTWPPKARIPRLNPPIPCPLSSITFSLGKQKEPRINVALL